MKIETLLEESGKFKPLRFATRKFYEKLNGNFKSAGITKCIEKYRSPYIAINRPLLPIGIGSLNLKYPNFWLAVGVAEKFCSNEKKRIHLLAKDLPPLILKYQQFRKLNSAFLNALLNETQSEITKGQLYKLTVGLGLKISLQKVEANLEKMLNMKKLIKFIKAIEETAMPSAEGEGLIISPNELDKIYEDIYSEEIQRWYELKQEQKEQKESNNEIELPKPSETVEKQNNNNAYKSIYSKYENLAIDEDIADQDTEIGYAEFEEQNDIDNLLSF